MTAFTFQQVRRFANLPANDAADYLDAHPVYVITAKSFQKYANCTVEKYNQHLQEIGSYMDEYGCSAAFASIAYSMTLAATFNLSLIHI